MGHQPGMVSWKCFYQAAGRIISQLKSQFPDAVDMHNPSLADGILAGWWQGW